MSGRPSQGSDEETLFHFRSYLRSFFLMVYRYVLSVIVFLSHRVCVLLFSSASPEPKRAIQVKEAASGIPCGVQHSRAGLGWVPEGQPPASSLT